MVAFRNVSENRLKIIVNRVTVTPLLFVLRHCGTLGMQGEN